MSATTQPSATLEFPLRAKKHANDVAICYRYTSRCGRYVVEHVRWVLRGYADFWASWYIDEARATPVSGPRWTRLGRHTCKRTAMRACLTHAKRQAAIGSN